MPKLDFSSFESRLAAEPPRQVATRSGTVASADGLDLAFAVYCPDQPPSDVLVFYHGGGANMAAGYDRLAAAVAATSPVAVCLTDMRGHGHSGGRRGHARRPELVWRDVDAVAGEMRRLFPRARLHLGGHSSGAGLLVNALSQGWPRAPVASLALVAPNFGYHANLERGDAQFGDAAFWPFIVNWFSAGRLAGGVPAVRLDFSGLRMARAVGCVERYSVNMALAVTPSDPGGQLARVRAPIWVALAEGDEIIDPDRTASFLARHAPEAQVVRLAGCSHLGVLLDAAPSLAAALTGRNDAIDPKSVARQVPIEAEQA